MSENNDYTNSNENENGDSGRENVCSICLRSESNCGKLMKMPPGIYICNDCMQKTFDMMNNSPFMLYFGQEYGERGMEEEGFSGRDGRTTIFDYWAVESVVSKNRTDVRDHYKNIMKLAAEPLFVEGGFYDLTYCNYDNPSFDIHRQFAFIRHLDKKVALVVANFDPVEKHVVVNIPEEALRFVGLPVKPQFLHCEAHIPAYDSAIIYLKKK